MFLLLLHSGPAHRIPVLIKFGPKIEVEVGCTCQNIKTAVKNKVPLVQSLTLNWVTFCIETSNKAVVLKLHKEYVPICMEDIDAFELLKWSHFIQINFSSYMLPCLTGHSFTCYHAEKKSYLCCRNW